MLSRCPSYLVLMSLLLGAENGVAFVAPTVSTTARATATASSFSSSLGVIPPELSSLDMVDVSALFQPETHHSLLSSSMSLSNNLILDAIQSEPEPFKYWFMFPTVTCIAICCQLAGIGGAALLSPIFLLVFPLLGPDYPLETAASAIASALLSEVFGFASGLSGYWSRGLVDWGVAAQYLILSMPFALGGALLASTVASNTLLLRGVYAALMLGLSAYLTFSESPEELTDEECEVPEIQANVRTKEAADGTIYRYVEPESSSSSGTVATGSGALLTGLLGVGIGEVVLPQLIRLRCMPLPVAAGTSVAVVVVTALTAALVQFANLATQVSGPETSLIEGLVQVVPWSLVQFTIPGALLGGQIAPFLASKKIFDDETIEEATAALFGIIGVAFAVKCATSLG